MKLRVICKSKIHRAVVTGADLDYIGSIGIDQTLMDLTGLVVTKLDGTAKGGVLAAIALWSRERSLTRGRGRRDRAA